MYIISSKFNSTFETISKVTGVKMIAKAVGKISNFVYSLGSKTFLRSIKLPQNGLEKSQNGL